MALFNNDVNVSLVSDLYQKRARLDVEGYYEKGEVNPFNSLCSIIAEKFTYYIIVQINNEQNVATARAIIKGLAKRKKVRELEVERTSINYQRFGTSSNLLLLWT